MMSAPNCRKWPFDEEHVNVEIYFLEKSSYLTVLIWNWTNHAKKVIR